MTRSFADIAKLKKPNEVTVELIMEPELTRSLEELYKRKDRAERDDKRYNRTPEAPKLSKEIEALESQIEDSKVPFTFRDPGRAKFDALIDSCPPTAEDKKLAQDAGQGVPSWHPDTFVPGLIALCSVDPEISFDEAQAIYNDWGRGDVEALFNTAIQACLEQASIPFTKRGTDEILDSVRNLITQQREESPTDSS